MFDRLKTAFRGKRFDPSPRDETWRWDPSGEGVHERDLFVVVHPAQSSKIVIMLPGWDGAIDGYEQKYVKLANYLVEQGVGAVVRSGNPAIPGHPFETTCKAILRGVAGGALARAEAICGYPSPQLLLVGWSAGASAIAALAPELPRVERALLMAPSGDAGEETVISGLNRFQGDLFVVVGANDEVVLDLPQRLFALAVGARSKRLEVLPDCDHQFRGAHNGRLMSQALLWAFADAPGFPDPEAGIHLYD
ncbi:MAG: hypothetical protein JKY65_33770 [Planctomycetes bacterium]|nr:hypothetical protein [Planctomycetota bacterium]